MKEFGNTHSTYSCSNCRTPFAMSDDLLSKAFKAKSGQAYMFSHAMNIALGQKRDAQLITGVFTIADLYCSNCREVLGWKYIRAYDASQNYKVGRFIIEKAKILKEYL